MYVVVNQDIVS